MKEVECQTEPIAEPELPRPPLWMILAWQHRWMFFGPWQDREAALKFAAKRGNLKHLRLVQVPSD